MNLDKCRWPLSDASVAKYGHRECGMPKNHAVHHPRPDKHFSDSDTCHRYTAESAPYVELFGKR